MTDLIDLVYREKRRGSITEPWVTQVVRVRGADTDPLHVTWQVQPARQDAIQECAEPEAQRGGSDGSLC